MTLLPGPSSAGGGRPIRLLMATTLAYTTRAFLLPFADHFRGLGWRVDLLAKDAVECPRCREHFDRLFEAPWGRSLRHMGNYTRAPKEVRRVVADGDYDLVHVHTPIAAWITRFALRNAREQGRPKLVYTAHGFHFYSGGSPAKNFLFRKMETLAGPWTDRLVVINPEDFEAARRHGIVSDGRLTLMPGIGVDARGLRPDSVSPAQVEAFRASLGLGASDHLFALPAEFMKHKRQADLVEALARLRRPDIHVAFAGAGPLQPRIEALAHRRGVAQQSHFLGFRHDLPVIMRSCDAMVLCSSREGLPRTILEAMCLGVPVIGSRIRGIRDLLADGVGLLFEPGNHQQLAAAMRNVADRLAPLDQMKEAGRRRVMAYDLLHVLELHEKMYNELLSR